MSTKGAGIVVGVTLGLVVLWYFKDKLGQVAGAVNPLNDKNLVNTGANALVQAATGSRPGSDGVASDNASTVIAPTVFDSYDPNAKPGAAGSINKAAPPEADFWGFLAHTLSPVTFAAPKAAPVNIGTTKAK
jgi:hypothetical protein